VAMPCCGREGSSVGYCRRCIEIICEQAQGVGRCPSCRQYISIDSSGRVAITENRGQCRMCRQTKIIVNNQMCDDCLLGSRFALRYECNRCHRLQTIPHPMWWYQPTPTEFGSASWACHCGCGDYTYWRVASQDVHRVPDFDCPEGWGRREQWLEAVRRQRLQEQGRGQERPGGCTVA